MAERGGVRWARKKQSKKCERLSLYLYAESQFLMHINTPKFVKNTFETAANVCLGGVGEGFFRVLGGFSMTKFAACA